METAQNDMPRKLRLNVTEFRMQPLRYPAVTAYLNKVCFCAPAWTGLNATINVFASSTCIRNTCLPMAWFGMSDKREQYSAFNATRYEVPVSQPFGDLSLALTPAESRRAHHFHAGQTRAAHNRRALSQNNTNGSNKSAS